MSTENYPSKVKVLTNEEAERKWAALGWGKPPSVLSDIEAGIVRLDTYAIAARWAAKDLQLADQCREDALISGAMTGDFKVYLECNWRRSDRTFTVRLG